MGLVHVLVAVPKIVFLLVCSPSIAIGFCASEQLVFIDFLPCHSSGGGSDCDEGEG
jgi:hypothetical protein